MPDFQFEDPKLPVEPKPTTAAGIVGPDGPFGFLSKIPVAKESDFRGNTNPPLRFPLPPGSDAAAVIQGLKSLNPSVEAEYSKGDGVLSVLIPPTVRVGSDPVDLREVAFVLKCQKEIEDLKLPGTWEHCCGDRDGCCANKG